MKVCTKSSQIVDPELLISWIKRNLTVLYNNEISYPYEAIWTSLQHMQTRFWPVQLITQAFYCNYIASVPLKLLHGSCFAFWMKLILYKAQYGREYGPLSCKHLSPHHHNGLADAYGTVSTFRNFSPFPKPKNICNQGTGEQYLQVNSFLVTIEGRTKLGQQKKGMQSI